MSGFRQFYATIAVVAFCCSVPPVYAPLEREGVVVTFYSLWTLAGKGVVDAVLGLVILLAVVATCAVVTIRSRERVAGPIVLGCLAVAALLMLVMKPGMGSDAPDLSTSGLMLVGLSILSIVVACAHLWHLARRPSRRVSRQSSPAPGSSTPS